MNKVEIACSLLDAWDARDLKKTASLLAEDFALTGPAPVPLNKEAYLTFQSVHNDAFSDWKFNIHNVQESGDSVRMQIRITATNDGPYNVSRLGLPIPTLAPTGKFMRWNEEVVTVTVKGDKVVAGHVELGPGGGVIGTLERMGVKVPGPVPAGH